MYRFDSINQSTQNLTVSLNDFVHLLISVSILFILKPCHAPMLNKIILNSPEPLKVVFTRFAKDLFL